MRILVVDDEDSVRLLLADLLCGWGHQVTSAASALEGLACLGTDPTIQLLLTDWMMPDLDGLELCRLVRQVERPGYLHIILMTAHSQKENLLAALEAGADAFLSKSYDHSELRAQLRAAERILSLEERLAQQVAAAEEASQAKSRFLASVSHEIRTPMNGVLGLARQLSRMPELSSAPREYAEMIRQSAENLLVILDDILDFSKLDAERMKLSPGPLRLDQVVGEALAPFVGRAEQKGIALTGVIQPAVPHVVEGDPARLRQVLMNLVSNAVRFTDRGAVTVWADWVRGELVLTVEDTGCGVQESLLAQIFEPFRQAPDSHGGTGLGLAICRRLADLMGATLELASRVGEGTRVTFRAPLPVLESAGGVPPATRGRAAILAPEGYHAVLQAGARAAGLAPEIVRELEAGEAPVWLVIGGPPWPERGRLLGWGRDLPATAQSLPRPLTSSSLGRLLQAEQAAPPPSVARQLGLRVLAVEDNPINQTVLRLMLQEHGCQVDTVSDGRTALQRLSDQAYALIFMDLRMPGLNGFESTLEIRRLEERLGRPPCQLVILTAQTQDGDRERARQAGADAFLAKPLVAEELEKLLEALT